MILADISKEFELYQRLQGNFLFFLNYVK